MENFLLFETQPLETNIWAKDNKVLTLRVTSLCISALEHSEIAKRLRWENNGAQSGAWSFTKLVWKVSLYIYAFAEHCMIKINVIIHDSNNMKSLTVQAFNHWEHKDTESSLS